MTVPKGFYLLLEGYLHQDWDLEHGSVEEVVRAFVRDCPDRTVRLALHDIDEILESGMSESRMNRAFRAGLGPFSKRFPHPRWHNTLLWFRETIETELAVKKQEKREEHGPRPNR